MMSLFRAVEILEPELATGVAEFRALGETEPDLGAEEDGRAAALPSWGMAMGWDCLLERREA